MEQRNYDVVIIGAGPGGSAAALYAAKKGLKAVLVDKAKFPRDKTCGDGISGKSMRVLKELGLTSLIEQKEHSKMRGVIFSGPNGQLLDLVAKDVPYCGYVVRREVFDNTLFQEASKVTEAMQETSFKDLVFDGDQVKGVIVTTKDNEDIQLNCKVVIAADGALTPVGRRLGKERMPEDHVMVGIRGYYKGINNNTDRIEIHFLESLIPGYFWIFPTQNPGEANIGLCIIEKYSKQRKINIRNEVNRVIKEETLFKERFVNAELVSEMRGWNLPLGSLKSKKVYNGALLIGDAANLIDPITGEGIGNALLTAKFAIDAIADAIETGDFSERGLKSYDEMIEKEIWPELKLNTRLTKLGRSKFLMNLFFNKASKDPKMAEMLSQTLIKEKSSSFSEKVLRSVF
ncbi:MAG: geranylgeranyl reductase family protein [DPANN group archaeon]|nr:geranylgeranyl reductase family protein [DPANN group archaeon]